MPPPNRRAKRGLRVALVAVDPWTNGAGEGLQPFNYSIRRIQASLVGDPGLRELEVRVFDFHAESSALIHERLEAFDPDVVGASAYLWSLPTLVDTARRLKRARADRAIVFGGPSARPEMLALEPFSAAVASVDALVIGEGELVIRELVRLVAEGRRSEFGSLPGVSVPRDGTWSSPSDRARIAKLDDLPSPHQLGLVRKGLTAHLETYRGCPMTCAYCQWGVLGGVSPVFSKDYLVRELKAYRKAQTRGIFHVDAALNLNAAGFRNLRAAEDEVGLFAESEDMFYCEVYPSHLTAEHFEFLSAVRNPNVGVGLQSFDSKVLRALERPFEEARFERMLERLMRISKVTLQIIMGLPGDNPKSFRRTFERARRYGCRLNVHHCLVLPDALLTRGRDEFDIAFDPVTLRMHSCAGWSPEDFRREWDHVGDVVTREEGDFIPMYFAMLTPASERTTAAIGRAKTGWHGFEPSDRVMHLRDRAKA